MGKIFEILMVVVGVIIAFIVVMFAIGKMSVPTAAAPATANNSNSGVATGDISLVF